MQKVGVTQDLFRILGLGPAFNGPFMKWIELGCHGVSHCSPQRSMPHSTKAGQEMEVKEDVRRKEWGGDDKRGGRGGATHGGGETEGLFLQCLNLVLQPHAPSWLTTRRPLRTP